MFAECRSSDTRQNQSLPSASDETLGKHNFAECLKKYTRQTFSRASHAPVPVGWRSGRYCLPSAGYGTLDKPSFAECLTVNTRQTMSRAPHRTVTMTVTPLPRPVLVTTSVTGTSCRVRGVGHSAKYIFAECCPWDTWQRSVNAECIMLALGIQPPLPSVFFGSRQS